MHKQFVKTYEQFVLNNTNDEDYMEQEINLYIQVDNADLISGDVNNLTMVSSKSLKQLFGTIYKTENPNELKVSLSVNAEYSLKKLLHLVTKISLYNKETKEIIPFTLIKLVEEAEIYGNE